MCITLILLPFNLTTFPRNLLGTQVHVCPPQIMGRDIENQVEDHVSGSARSQLVYIATTIKHTPCINPVQHVHGLEDRQDSDTYTMIWTTPVYILHPLRNV